MRKRIKLAALFSGGKDSCMALYRALNFYDVNFTLSFIANPESYMFHYPNIRLVEYSSSALGIPAVMKEVSRNEEEAIFNALSELKKKGVEGVVCGAVRSNYQYSRIERICNDLDLIVYAPFWQTSHEDLIRESINIGFETLIVGVYADGLDVSWLGRKLDLKALEDLKKLNEKFHIDIGGEGGEYETFVLDAPMFKKKIVVEEAETVWDKVRGEFNIKKVKLLDKLTIR